MAIAGALVAAPTATSAASAAVKPAASAASHQSAKATLDAYKSAAVHAKATRHSAAGKLTANSTYTVQSGDTLAKIANNEYHKASDWQWLFHENSSKISDPDEIYPGQSLNVPADPPAGYTLPSSEYQPRHAAPASDSDTVVTQSATSSGGSHASAGGSSASASGSTSMSGTLGCSGLEQLWENAGGNSGDAEMAASIAMAESGGNQYAVSPTNDVGYWQINESNGSLATTDPYGNARAAIQLSDDGSNWGAWTTYTSGAYAGKC